MFADGEDDAGCSQFTTWNRYYPSSLQPTEEPDRYRLKGRGGGQQQGRVENAPTASVDLAVSRDNWDTVYYRLRAIRGAQCVIG